LNLSGDERHGSDMVRVGDSDGVDWALSIEVFWGSVAELMEVTQKQRPEIMQYRVCSIVRGISVSREKKTGITVLREQSHL